MTDRVNAPKTQTWPLGDSNPDTFRHKILSLACLPISPSGLRLRNSDTLSLSNGSQICEFLAIRASERNIRPMRSVVNIPQGQCVRTPATGDGSGMKILLRWKKSRMEHLPNREWSD